MRHGLTWTFGGSGYSWVTLPSPTPVATCYEVTWALEEATHRGTNNHQQEAILNGKTSALLQDLRRFCGYQV